MILTKFSDIEHLQLHLIKSPIHIIEKELGDILVDTMNKKWMKRVFDLKLNKLKNYFDSKTNFTEIVKCVIWQPESINFNLSVFLTNIPDGWPSIINKYYSQYKSEVFRAVFCDTDSEFPLYAFEYKNKETIRVIQSMKEEKKWEFFEKGTMLPFENGSIYKKRRIADRLNNEIIYEYLLTNGIDILNDKFWNSKGMAFEFVTKFE